VDTVSERSAACFSGNSHTARDAHIYLAVTHNAYGFIVNERHGDRKQEAELTRVIGASLYEATDNFTGTLLAARHAVATAREFGAFRNIYIHNNERSICSRAVCIPRWRESGVYLTSKGQTLKKETEWRNLVDAIGNANVVFLYAPQFTLPRKMIADIKTLLLARSEHSGPVDAKQGEVA
jgi:hypothetical protein